MKLPRGYEIDLAGATIRQTILPADLLSNPAEQPPAAPAKRKRTPNPLPIAARLELAPAVARPGPWTVTIPEWHPLKLNILMETPPKWRSGLKRKDAIKLGRALRAAYVPAASTPRRLTLVIVLGPRQRGGDPDAYNKVSFDGLVKAGALVDDNRQWLDPEKTRYERGPIMATRIILEDLVS